MKYFYITETTGKVWGSFDSLQNAERFAETLTNAYDIRECYCF